MTPLVKFAIGVTLTAVGLAVMTLANRQMIAAANCEDCDDEVTAVETEVPGD